MYSVDNLRIKDLPKDEQPRERLYKLGPSQLKTSELIALILKSGFKGTTALQLGEQILTTYDNDLKRMSENRPKQFESVKGVGAAKAAQLVAAFELGRRLAKSHSERIKIGSPKDVADHLMPIMRDLRKEVVCVMCLDTKGGVASQGIAGDTDNEVSWGKKLSEKTVFEGTLNASVFHPREIFRFAIEESANSIVLAHNHPSGDPQPSQEDIRATKQLIEAGNYVGIKVLDHIIIGDGIFYSLKEEGVI
ncbi:hypothetical protein C6497_04585 [Candidatus Poribacteria bacterium]|nr:MAG: hypothetical protein C6497_04585 [Candidatus Poribacteria bacterium]